VALNGGGFTVLT